MKLTRRDLTVMLPALAAAQTAAAQGKDKPTLASKAYRFEDLPEKVNGENRSRDVFNGKNHTGFPVDIHITNLGPGLAPHAPHHHAHEEIVMLQTGMLDVTIEGKLRGSRPGRSCMSTPTRSTGGRTPDRNGRSIS